MSSDSVEPPLLAPLELRPPFVRSWANGTLCFGFLGAIAGATSGVVSGAGAQLLAASYSANALVMGGTYLVLREGVAYVTQSALGATGSSAIAGAIVGGGAAARMLGVSRVPGAALTYACAAAAGQLVIDETEAWRALEAARIIKQRALLAQLSPAEKAAYSLIRSSVTQGELNKADDELGPYETMLAAADRARGGVRVIDEHAPPRAPTLEAFVDRMRAARGEAPLALSAPLPSGASTAAADAIAPTTTAAAAAATATAAGFLSWFPVSIDADASDARRLLKARQRLEEVELTLGLRSPEIDPRVAALVEREKRIVERQKLL